MIRKNVNLLSRFNVIEIMYSNKDLQYQCYPILESGPDKLWSFIQEPTKYWSFLKG